MSLPSRCVSGLLHKWERIVTRGRPSKLVRLRQIRIALRYRPIFCVITVVFQTSRQSCAGQRLLVRRWDSNPRGISPTDFKTRLSFADPIRPFDLEIIRICTFNYW
jgi:hypothetical protein